MKEEQPKSTEYFEDTQPQSDLLKKRETVFVVIMCILGLLLIVSLGIAGYLVYQNNLLGRQLAQEWSTQPESIVSPTQTPKQPLPSPTPQSNQTQLPTPTEIPSITLTYKDAPHDWLEYINDDVGFSLNYPPEIGFTTNIQTAEERRAIYDSYSIVLDICVDPRFQDEEPDSAFLEKYNSCQWEIRDDWGWSIAESRRFVNIDDIKAKSITILGKFDICSVMFIRTFAFDKNNFHVEITVNADPEQVKSTIDNYLTTDSANCGQEKVLNSSSIYHDWAEKNVPGLSQEWFNVYDQIIQTVSIK